MYSIHQVATASRNDLTVSTARFRDWLRVIPPAMMSKDEVLFRRSATYFARASMSLGLGLSPGLALYFCGMIPSHSSARPSDLPFGQTPMTQIGIRGDCTGTGSIVIRST